MRTKPLLGLLIVGFVAVIIIPAMTSGQQPGGGKKMKGPGGGGAMDPNSVFDKYAKGQPYVLINDLWRGKEFALQFAREKGITNGQLTRAQFIEFQEQLNAKFFAAPGMGKGPGGGGPRKSNTDPGTQTANTTPAPAPNPDFVNSLADVDFRRLDTNADGKLNMDEMPDRLKNSLAKWDKNKDGLIDLLEYREYYREAFAARLGGSGPGSADQATRNVAAIIIDDDELDRKEVVFRAGPGGKMPAGIPPWFEKLDIDGDGQVALYEWRKGGKPLDEFKDWDLNDDGFISPEEAVKVQTALGKPGTSNSTASGPPAGSADKGNRPVFMDGSGRPMQIDWSAFRKDKGKDKDKKKGDGK
jgi:EF hand